MKRKLVKQGKATLMVSLPAEWVKKYGLAKGDEVDLQEQGNTVFINAKKNLSKEKAKITVPNNESIILRYLYVMHLRGVDELEVIFKDSDTIDTIQKVIRSYVHGYQIISNTSKGCVLKSVEFGIPGGFDQLFRRNFLVIVSMAEEIHKALDSKKSEQFKNIKYLEDTNNRLNYILQRDLVLNNYKEAKKTPFVYYLNEELERIGDQMKFLCDYLKPDMKIGRETVELWKNVSELLRADYDFYFTKKEKGEKLLKLRDQTVDKAIKTLTSKNKHEAMVAHYVLIISQLAFELIESISAIVL